MGGMNGEKPTVYHHLKTSTVSAKFLKTNQTSHAWVFGAIAELLDNAMDPDCMANSVHISLRSLGDEPALIIMDDGNGMDPDCLLKVRVLPTLSLWGERPDDDSRSTQHHTWAQGSALRAVLPSPPLHPSLTPRLPLSLSLSSSVPKPFQMLSFGFSDKTQVEVQGRRSIGHYGNGFKSGSMRIGHDALVLTKCKESQSVGLLSSTFLDVEHVDQIYLPMLTWDHNGKLEDEGSDRVREGLDVITKYSIFENEETILAEMDAIEETGTMIIITKLKKLGGEPDSPYELVAAGDDIQIQSFDNSAKFQQMRSGQGMNVDIPLDYSLRAYVSVLYKVPRMQVILMEKRVKCQRVTGLLSERMQDSYKPNDAKVAAHILIGFSESEQLYGMMMYHNNRLIKPYVRVGVQMEANAKGVGVLGVVDADFLSPMHNKQDFADTKQYRGLINKLSTNVNCFWWDKVEKPEKEEREAQDNSRRSSVKRKKRGPDVKWVQCGLPSCGKWRILPPETDMAQFKDSDWFCWMHPDPKISGSNHEWPEDTWEKEYHVAGAVDQASEKRKEWIDDRKLKKKREEERNAQALALHLAQTTAQAPASEQPAVAPAVAPPVVPPVASTSIPAAGIPDRTEVTLNIPTAATAATATTAAIAGGADSVAAPKEGEGVPEPATDGEAFEIPEPESEEERQRRLQRQKALKSLREENRQSHEEAANEAAKMLGLEVTRNMLNQVQVKTEDVPTSSNAHPVAEASSAEMKPVEGLFEETWRHEIGGELVQRPWDAVSKDDILETTQR